MVNRIEGTGRVASVQTAAKQPERDPQGGFGAMLQERLREKQAQPINFSKHAMERAEERGIDITTELMLKLQQSVGKAQEKGAKNILAFDQNQAFIINIPYGRVITTMSQEEMRENIFTNIDGAVLL